MWASFASANNHFFQVSHVRGYCADKPMNVGQLPAAHLITKETNTAALWVRCFGVGVGGGLTVYI